MHLDQKNLKVDYMRFLVASVMAQWVFALYSAVDGMFVARGVSEIALSAVNIASPFINFLFSLSLLFAAGTSTVAAIYMGGGEKEKADKVTSQNLTFLLVVSAVITAFVLIFPEQVASFLGATETTMPYVGDYIVTIAPFSVCFIVAYAFEILVKTDGYPKYATIAIILGCLIHCFLDLVLVIWMDMGVKGAALASGTAQLSLVAIYLKHFLSPKATLKFVRFRFDVKEMLRVAKVGLPSGLTEFSAGITVATSTMGMMIPPSIPMIMFSMISGASAGALFMAGMVPGIMVGLLQLVVCYTISKKNGYHPKYDTKITLKEILTILVTSLPTVSMPLLIIASISFGICTASESAAVAVAYSIIVGVFLYKKLTLKDVLVALRKTLVSSASICIIIAFSNIFTWIMTMMQIPQTVAGFFLSLDLPVWVALIILDLLILFLGTFIDVSPAILMLTPILLPITRGLGMSDWQFGGIFIIGLAIGLVTPPVGMCLNACSKINGMSITKIGKAALPFTVCNVVVLILVTFIPALSNFLPTLFGYMS